MAFSMLLLTTLTVLVQLAAAAIDGAAGMAAASGRRQLQYSAGFPWPTQMVPVLNQCNATRPGVLEVYLANYTYPASAAGPWCFKLTALAGVTSDSLGSIAAPLNGQTSDSASFTSINAVGFEIGKTCSSAVASVTVQLANNATWASPSLTYDVTSYAAGVLNISFPSPMYWENATNARLCLTLRAPCATIGSFCGNTSACGSFVTLIAHRQKKSCYPNCANGESTSAFCTVKDTWLVLPPPVNCSGSFSAASVCTASCGGGTQNATYVVTQEALDGGSPCPYANGTTLQNACNTQACAVNCVGAWSAYGACSAACGGGTQVSTYSITTPAANGGTACPYANGTTQTQACNTQACAVNCVGAWSAYGACSAACGGGTQVSTYSITTPAADGGTACPYANGTTQTQACNTQACAVNCVGAWSAYGACSAACGGGTQVSTYSITTPAANGGTACPYANGTTQTQACNTQACAVNCVGAWSAYGACSAACGGGTQVSTYSITTPAANGGTACPYANGTTQTQACNTQACAVNCVGAWSAYGACSAACGGGTQVSTYSITTPAADGGTACPYANGTTQTQACNTQACAVNCVGAWSAYGACSAACGGGTQVSTYSITTPAANGGTACPYANGTTQTQACNTQACAVNCVGAWSAYGACSAACGGGTQVSTYSITTPAANGGTACPYANGTTQTQACNTQPCPSPSPADSPSPSPDSPSPSPDSPLPSLDSPSPSPDSPSPSPADSPSPSLADSPSPSPADSPSPSLADSPSPSPADSPLPSPADSPSPSPADSTSPSPADSPSPSPADSPLPSPADSPLPSPDSPSPSPADSPSPSPADSPLPSPADSPSPSPADSPSPSPADSPSPSPADSPSPSPADSPSPSPADSPSPSPADSPSPSPADSPSPLPADSPSPSPADSPSPLPADSPSPSPADSPSPSPADSPSPSPADSPLPSPADSPLPSPDSPSPSPADSPSPSPADSPSPLPADSPSPSPADSPSPSPADSTSPSPADSPSPSPADSPLPSPADSPLPSPDSPSSSPADSPSPSPADSPSTGAANASSPEPLTDSDLVPFISSPPVLPPLPLMNTSDVRIRGGSISIKGVKIDGLGSNSTFESLASYASSITADFGEGITNTTGGSLANASLSSPKTRRAAFNGSLGFVTFGVVVEIDGDFALQRVMNWSYDASYQAWITQVSVAGTFTLTRDELVDNTTVSSSTLEPRVSGLLTLFSAIWPGPGFSGLYDWAGSLAMTPNPFVVWQDAHMILLNTNSSSTNSSGSSSRRLLQSSGGNSTGQVPVQGRVSVRETVSSSNTTAAAQPSSSGGSTATPVDDTGDILVLAAPISGPSGSTSSSLIGGSPAGASTPATTCSGITCMLGMASLNDGSSSTGGPGKVPKDPSVLPDTASSSGGGGGGGGTFTLGSFQVNTKLFIIIGALAGPLAVALCALGVVAGVLHRKRRRKEEETRRTGQQAAGADGVGDAAAEQGESSGGAAAAAGAASSSKPAGKKAGARLSNVRRRLSSAAGGGPPGGRLSPTSSGEFAGLPASGAKPGVRSGAKGGRGQAPSPAELSEYRSSNSSSNGGSPVGIGELESADGTLRGPAAAAAAAGTKIEFLEPGETGFGSLDGTKQPAPAGRANAGGGLTVEASRPSFLAGLFRPGSIAGMLRGLRGSQPGGAYVVSGGTAQHARGPTLPGANRGSLDLGTNRASLDMPAVPSSIAKQQFANQQQQATTVPELWLLPTKPAGFQSHDIAAQAAFWMNVHGSAAPSPQGHGGTGRESQPALASEPETVLSHGANLLMPSRKRLDPGQQRSRHVASSAAAAAEPVLPSAGLSPRAAPGWD